MAKSTKKVAKPAKKAGASRPAAKKTTKAGATKASKVVKKAAPAAKGTGKLIKKIAHKISVVVKKAVHKKPEAPPARHASKESAKKTVPHVALQPSKGTVRPSKTRYNDSELEEFRKLIIEKLEAAKKELKYLQDQISRSGDNSTDDTENKYASVDDGGSSMEREYLNQMASRQRLYIDHLDKALVRIQNKTYGICRVTGKLIDKERLRAVPHATLSMEAKLMQSHPQHSINA